MPPDVTCTPHLFAPIALQDMIVPANPPVVIPFKVIVSDAAAVIKPSALSVVAVSTINAFPVIVSLALATCKTVRLNKVSFNVSVTAPADAIRMQWDADTDVVFQTLAGEMEYDYSSFGGLKNTEASGFTGDVNVVLPACTAGDTGTIVCEWIKVYES